MAAAILSHSAYHNTILENSSQKASEKTIDINSIIGGRYSATYYANKIKITELNSKWQKETALMSDINQVLENRNFKEIVDIGKDAIPVILNEIDINPGPLVWALNIITKSKISENPIPLEESCKLWVLWGESEKIIF